VVDTTSHSAILPNKSSKTMVATLLCVSQTSFDHISINSLMILMVLEATKSPQKDLLIDASHVLR